ncbi:hypothetical protein EC988_006373, partial [Linderina pennispora]
MNTCNEQDDDKDTGVSTDGSLQRQFHNHAGERSRLCTDPSSELFDESNPRIQRDIIRLIAQYLDTQGYAATKVTLYDEANVKQRQEGEYISDVVRLRAAVLDGEWAEAERLCSGAHLQDKKQILYNVYKQRYLELIDDGEPQKAFAVLMKHLKALEAQQAFAGEFRDLCYLLTAKSIADAPAFRNWDGIASARERLAEYLQSILEFEITGRERLAMPMQPNRLLHLLRQAVAYQIESCEYHAESVPQVPTLLADYAPETVPNSAYRQFAGHLGNVKCAAWAGEAGRYLASGSSDNTVRVWDTDSGECRAILKGHGSRIWDVCADRRGDRVFSASGDGSVRVWDIRDLAKPQCVAVVDGVGDVYSVGLNAAETHVIMAGYDRAVRVYDLAAQRTVQRLVGHELSVASATTNALGNLVVSGSKDQTIKFWDTLSGTCVRTLRSHLGEVTSVAAN